MVTILLLLISIWGIVSYVLNKKQYFLVALVLVISSVTNLLPSSVMAEDMALFMGGAVILYDIIDKHKVFSVKNDPIGKIIIVLLLYYFLEVIITVAKGDETFVYALKVYRRDLFYLYYFIFRRFSLADIRKAYQPLLCLTLIGGILYYLQFVGIHLLENGSDEQDVDSGGFYRYVNTPILGIPFLFYIIVRRKKIQFASLIFFIGFLIMPMSRGGIIAAIIAFTYYIIKSRKISQYKSILAKLALLLLLFSPVLIFRFVKDNERGTAMQDIDSASSISDFSYFNYRDSGTFTFRIALALERLDYMMNHPEKILMGVGAIHEQSPNNRFVFYIGTGFDEVDGGHRRQAIDTEDIAYVSHTFRYGILYLILFGCFIYLSFYRLKKVMKIHAIGAVGFIFFLTLFINSLSSDVYSFLRIMLVPLLCLAIVYRYKPDEVFKYFPSK